jgi:uncharacterized membrane protein
MLLLFTLSLIPFATSYLGEHEFNRNAVWLYLGTMLLPSLAYTWLQAVIRRTGKQDPKSVAYHRQTSRKGALASAVYFSGIPLTFISPWLGVSCAGVVALLWFLPKSPIDRLFDGHGAGQIEA